MKQPLSERIEAAIWPHHSGRDNAITAPALARRLRVPERAVREAIAGSANFQPCSVPGEGFFWPADVEEIFDSEERLAKQEAALRSRRKLFRAFWEKQGITFPKAK